MSEHESTGSRSSTQHKPTHHCVPAAAGYTWLGLRSGARRPDQHPIVAWEWWSHWNRGPYPVLSADASDAPDRSIYYNEDRTGEPGARVAIQAPDCSVFDSGGRYASTEAWIKALGDQATAAAEYDAELKAYIEKRAADGNPGGARIIHREDHPAFKRLLREEQ
jgi:hypothetical protein